MDKAYLLDLIKIVEGAANADHDKVMAYARQLSDRLEADGEAEAAKRLKKILGGGKVSMLGLARANGTAAASPLPVDAESRLTTADEERLRPGDVEVFLPHDVDKAVRQFMAFYRGADRLVADGVGISPTMLIYGPPGCGKTQLARYIAAELGLPLITARADGLISSYLGSTAKNIRLLFEHAESRPCVLFLDEFDALAKMRDDGRELGELKRVVISLLQNIDALGRENVLLAATNHEHLLDPAIWRRFAYKVHLTEPGAGAREAMARRFLGRFADEDLVGVLVAMTEGLSGAQLRLIADECVRAAILADREVVGLKDAAEAGLAANPKFAASDRSLPGRLRALREADPKLFTQSRLAEMFGVSQGQVCKLLKEG